VLVRREAAPALARSGRVKWDVAAAVRHPAARAWEAAHRFWRLMAGRGESGPDKSVVPEPVNWAPWERRDAVRRVASAWPGVGHSAWPLSPAAAGLPAVPPAGQPGCGPSPEPAWKLAVRQTEPRCDSFPAGAWGGELYPAAQGRRRRRLDFRRVLRETAVWARKVSDLAAVAGRNWKWAMAWPPGARDGRARIPLEKAPAPQDWQGPHRALRALPAVDVPGGRFRAADGSALRPALPPARDAH